MANLASDSELDFANADAKDGSIEQQEVFTAAISAVIETLRLAKRVGEHAGAIPSEAQLEEFPMLRALLADVRAA